MKGKKNKHNKKRIARCGKASRLYTAETFLSYYVKRISNIIRKEPFISIISISCGIEFLGKCINTYVAEWNEPSHSKEDFESAINHFDAFIAYRPWLQKYRLYNSLRCGTVHSLMTSTNIKLVNIGPHEETDDVLTFSAEQYLKHFSAAVIQFRKEKKKGAKSVDSAFAKIENNFKVSTTGTCVNDKYLRAK